MFTEKSSKDIITEENSSSDPQQVVEEAVTFGSEKITSKEPNSGNTFTTDELMYRIIIEQYIALFSCVTHTKYKDKLLKWMHNRFLLRKLFIDFKI